MSETGQDESAKEGAICEINITEVERRCSGTVMPLQDVYIAYQVESVIREPRKTPYIVWRRYRDFEYLHSHLQDTYRCVIIPPLPEKKVQFRWQKLPTDTLDPEFVERRRASLETFLRRVAAHRELSEDTLLGHFLRHEASWRDDHSPGGGLLHRADSMLRSLSASLRLRNPDREFEELKRYSTELKANLTNFLRSRARLVDATLDFHAVYQQYGQALSELSHREGPGGRGDHLQAAGQFMDRLAQAPLPFLEEQEEAADRIKEYLAYADALLAVCRHQELLQYELERKKSLYTARESQRSEMSQAAGSQQGLVSRLLHPSATTEQKAQALEQQLVSLDTEIRAATQSKQEFSEKALAEVAKFREQKKQDLTQAMTILVSTNIRLCKESIAIWERVCQCFEEMCRLEEGATPTKEQLATDASTNVHCAPAGDSTDSAVH
uniref:Putative sorting nexin ixodes scapularis sorting nexin n=1 Tax=Amblyomma triste TaxID=251400 RepID=A0A023GFV0_AMBTT